MAISFFNQGNTFQPQAKTALRKWVNAIAARENCKIKEINYIFCSDEELVKINLHYLKHNTLTDIITFDYSENHILSADIFISTERVEENAAKYGVSFLNELHRVMIHGILHLCGYKDKKEEDKQQMREKENNALQLLTTFTQPKKRIKPGA